ncbi:MAG TPA: D-alanyl-D-alanine carboxypeptidase/D-alanyl-D-alanine-endopeptidase [Burkholderiales bacterium]|nr:D-alanyl-D-alanine carboxypeptidase/D-alanyl-D-alanine-endopeptidase [Burkholderiales bacterium]
MRLTHLLALLVAAAALPGAAAPADQLPRSVAAALAQAGVPESQVGAYVHDLSADQPVLEVAADRAMNPASVMKLVTTLAGLEILGPSYTWKTEAWLDGPVDGDRLDGNLVLKGYGDPKFNLESLMLFVRDLRNRGLREINGDLVLDRSFFSVDDHDPAGFDNEPTRPYNVGPDALLINFKSFRLQFVPELDKGSVRIYAEPSLPQVTVVNRLKLAPGLCEAWPDKPAVNGNTLTFSGSFASSCGERARYFSLASPDEYAATLFRQFWLQSGGSWTGSVREAPLPFTARLFASWESQPLSEIIRDVNKYSINVMARQVYLTMGARESSAPGTLAKAERAVRDWLARRGLDFPEMVIDNGAGLSRDGRISARHLGQLLSAAWHSPLMPEFVASLPLTAVDGTMRKRLANSPAAGQAHIKTGYLEGVRAIAGYVLDARGRMLAVVMVINHPSARNAQAAQDAFLEWAQSSPQ